MQSIVMRLVLLASLALASQGLGASPAIRRASDLAGALSRCRPDTHTPRQFELTATVTFPPIIPYDSIIVRDGSGVVCLKDRTASPHPPLQIGDVIHAKGLTHVERNTPIAKCLALQVLSHTNMPPPKLIDPADFLSGENDRNVVKLVGIVKDVFRDEIDRGWTFMVLNCGAETIYAASPSPDINSGDMESLIGAKVSVSGFCSVADGGLRRQIGRILIVHGKDSIHTIQDPTADPFDVPEIGSIRHLRPLEISSQGRHRASGRVLAVWGGNTILIRGGDGAIMRVELANAAPPAYGTMVETVGFPETDLYRINLTRAIWRPLAQRGERPEDEIVNVSGEDVIKEGPDRAYVRSDLHGRTIRIKGSVRSLPAAGGSGRFYIDDGSSLIPIDISARRAAIRDIEVGCKIEVTGTCVMDVENWRPNSVFPKIKGFMVVVRRPEDIRILSHPPWWTPGRLMAVIGTLLALLAWIFVWNRMLNRLAERRGQELADEKVAHVTADLKVYERTRLAVELHDSLSQNLTGVSLAIRAANRLSGSDPSGMRRHLGLAARTLDSCRDELRNCLWDLRNQTLEEADMNEAIRQTLKPHVGDARLQIRFNVPRERLSDNTAHAILRIIRELASNAVRHGSATEIKVAGALERNRLFFSVADNGRGFDQQAAPDARQGHFGLQGIRDRVDGFDGDMAVKSAPGGGTKVTITIKTADRG